MQPRISLIARILANFRYNKQKAYETYDSYRPVDPMFWQVFVGVGILSTLPIIRYFVPWYLPHDFPPTQKEIDDYYAQRRIHNEKSELVS